MKTLLLVLLLTTFQAEAQTTIDLPLPDLHNYYTTLGVCTYDVQPHTVATGFSADGNYVLGHAKGYVACGHSGRGSNLHYTYYCMDFVWDLSGNFISGTVLPYAGCQIVYPGPIYTNAGYEEYTVTTYIYGYIQSQGPVLVSP